MREFGPRVRKYHFLKEVAPTSDSSTLRRAYRWKRMLESGEFNSISDLAAAEKINHSYVRRILRLTLLVAASLTPTVRS